MNVERDHVIHSRGGKLADGVSSVADVERIVGRAVGNARPRGIAIHFHGGLVNQAAALGIARRLAPVYDGAGAYPIFFVWESGVLEIVTHNLTEIAGEDIFKILLKYVLKFAVGKLGQAAGAKSIAAAMPNDMQMHIEMARPEPFQEVRVRSDISELSKDEADQFRDQRQHARGAQVLKEWYRQRGGPWP